MLNVISPVELTPCGWQGRGVGWGIKTQELPNFNEQILTEHHCGGVFFQLAGRYQQLVE